LIEGVQIDLKRAAPGSTVNLGLTRPTAAIEQSLTDFVTAYNEFTKALATQTSAGQGGAGAGPLRGDLGARELQRQLAQLPSQVLNSQGPIRTLSEIGVSTNRDGTLALNAARLKSVLERDPLGVEALFNPVQYSSDPAVAITSPMGRTKPGSYVLTDLVPASGATPASGLFDGVAAVANGSFLSAPSTARALGLAVEVKAAAAQVTITVDPGLGGALQAIRDTVRARTGPIAQSQDKLAAEPGTSPATGSSSTPAAPPISPSSPLISPRWNGACPPSRRRRAISNSRSRSGPAATTNRSERRECTWRNRGSGRPGPATRLLTCRAGSRREPARAGRDPVRGIAEVARRPDRRLGAQGFHAARRAAIAFAVDPARAGGEPGLEKGGDVAASLAAIYAEARRLVIAAGKQNDPSSITRAREMLAEIATAWKAIA
jgi:hypothetical protein